MISPTIGRRVWYWPNGADKTGICLDPAQAFDAGVIFVTSDFQVNLSVTDHTGRTFFARDVRLLQDADVPPDGKPYATWMPYQTTQAKKETSSDTLPAWMDKKIEEQRKVTEEMIAAKMKAFLASKESASCPSPSPAVSPPVVGSAPSPSAKTNTSTSASATASPTPAK